MYGRLTLILAAIVLAATLILSWPGPVRGQVLSDQGVMAPLRIMATEDPPTTYYDQDGRLTGIATEIAQAIEARLGMQNPIEIQPWARVVETAYKTPNIVIFTAGRTPEREALGCRFVGPIVTRRHILYKKAGSAVDAASLEDVARQQLTVGVMRGDWRATFLQERGVKTVAVPTHARHFLMLLKDRVDLSALADMQLAILAQMEHVNATSVEPLVQFDRRSAYFMFSPGTSPEIIARWEQAFADLQRGDFFTQGSARWSRRLGAPVAYAPEWGYFLLSAAPTTAHSQ